MHFCTFFKPKTKHQICAGKNENELFWCLRKIKYTICTHFFAMSICVFLLFEYTLTHMSLYTKYRPKDWDELIGQDAICTILKTSLRNEKVGHAYIFTGSRGTGKTSSARILAKGINCSDLQDGNPCHTCKNCLDFDDGRFFDVVELDAASHTQVDKMRELIEEASLAPNQ